MKRDLFAEELYAIHLGYRAHTSARSMKHMIHTPDGDPMPETLADDSRGAWAKFFDRYEVKRPASLGELPND